MNVAIKTGTETMTAWEIIPRLKRYQMLPQLIKEAIIDAAIAEINCTTNQTTQAIEIFYQQQGLTTPEARQAWLESRGMNQEDVTDIATRNLKIEKLKQEKFGGGLTSYFLQRKGQLDKVVFSIVRVSDMGLAQELYFRLEEGHSFAELAKTYSQGQEAAAGGIVPPMEMGKLPPAIASAFNSYGTGTILPPFPLGNEYVVIKIEQKISVQLDSQVRQRLLNEQFQAWLNKEVQRQGYSIENLLAS